MEAYVEAVWVVPVVSDALIAVGIALMIGIPALALLGFDFWKRIRLIKPRSSRARTLRVAYQHR